MAGAFLLTLREGFEATLLVAIVLAYLTKIDYRAGVSKVWYGVVAAGALSLAAAGLLFATSLELEGAAEEIFEGGAMLLAVVFLTYMILWMSRQSRGVAQDIRSGVDSAIQKGGSLALTGLVFVMVFREGLETALFMFGIAQTATPFQAAAGALLGIVAAIGLGYAVYAGGRRINLGAFFTATGLLLLVVAAGLLARGIAVFEEAGVLPELFQPVWDLSQFDPLTYHSVVGQFLGAFFGWNPSPDVLQVAAWVAYLAAIGFLFLRPKLPQAGREA